MKVVPRPQYIYVRIPKQEQKEREEKIGSIYLPPSFIFMSRGMQCAQIMAIGDEVGEVFPQAKIGHILLMHHFIEGKQRENADEGRYCVHSDNFFNYYLCTAKHFERRQNETFGVFDGRDIIPHPEFVFLEDEQPAVNNLNPNEFINASTKKKGSLYIFKNWVESRADKGRRMQELKFECQELAKSIMTDEIKKAIEMKEFEMSEISKEVNKRRYEPFIIAYSHPLLNKRFQAEVKKGDTLYILNQAANYKIEFMQKTYRVAKVDFCGLLYHPAVKEEMAI